MIRSPLKWFGGKYYFLNALLPFPKHIRFVEVFGGSGVVTLNKIPADDVYNDINGRLVNFYRVIQNRYEELTQLCRYRGSFQSRKLFTKYKEESPDSLEDAFRFFYINRFSFSGMNSYYAGLSTHRNQIKRSFDDAVNRNFPILANRLKYVNIEQQDYRKIIKRFDGPDTLFYFDPPYYEGGDEYERGIGGNPWKDSDFNDLWDILPTLKAKFVLSIDKKIERSGWYYESFERVNRAGTSKKPLRINEWIIRNFDSDKTKKMKPQNQTSIKSFF
jgi:DNA adenine methylase